jgi:hypothetical protein
MLQSAVLGPKEYDSTNFAAHVGKNAGTIYNRCWGIRVKEAIKSIKFQWWFYDVKRKEQKCT